MVVAARLQWIRDGILSGRSVSIHCCRACPARPSRTTTTFTISSETSNSVDRIALGYIECLIALAGTHCMWDRGHAHSSSTSVVKVFAEPLVPAHALAVSSELVAGHTVACCEEFAPLEEFDVSDGDVAADVRSHGHAREVENRDVSGTEVEVDEDEAVVVSSENLTGDFRVLLMSLDDRPSFIGIHTLDGQVYCELPDRWVCIGEDNPPGRIYFVNRDAGFMQWTGPRPSIADFVLDDEVDDMGDDVVQDTVGGVQCAMCLGQGSIGFSACSWCRGCGVSSSA